MTVIYQLVQWMMLTTTHHISVYISVFTINDTTIVSDTAGTVTVIDTYVHAYICMHTYLHAYVRVRMYMVHMYV